MNALNEPEKHTRFRLRDETVYGQLSVFSPEEKKDIVYTGMLIKSNILFTIQLQEGEVLHDILDTILIYSPEHREPSTELKEPHNQEQKTILQSICRKKDSTDKVP